MISSLSPLLSGLMLAFFRDDISLFPFGKLGYFSLYFTYCKMFFLNLRPFFLSSEYAVTRDRVRGWNCITWGRFCHILPVSSSLFSSAFDFMAVCSRKNLDKRSQSWPCNWKMRKHNIMEYGIVSNGNLIFKLANTQNDKILMNNTHEVGEF